MGGSSVTGPIPASISALTRLASLYAPPRLCGLSAESGVRMGASLRRILGDNRFSGSVGSTISALTALTYLYAANPGRACVKAAHASL